MSSHARLMEKLRKLHALANDPTGNVNECQAAAARLARLLLEHRISEAELGVTFQTESIFFRVIKHHKPPKWWIHLLCSLAKLHGCAGIRGRKHDKGLWVFGPEERCVAVKYGYAWLWAEIDRCHVVERKGGFRHTKEAFCTGATDRCIARMREQQEAVRREAESTWAGSTALAVIDRQDQKVQEELDEVFGKKAPVESVIVANDTNGYLAGWRRGAEVALPDKAAGRALG